MDEWTELSVKPPKSRWEVIHERAVSATKAAWEYAHNHVPSREIAHAKFTWRPGWTSLHCDIGSTRYKSTSFFAVDNDADPDLLVNRLKLDCQRYAGKMLYLGIPESTQHQLGRSEHRLRVFTTNSEETLARLWCDAVAKLDRGPQAVNLWSPTPTHLQPWTPDYLSSRPLNSDQQLALAAMTTPGGYFVWGPPGTGKTTVITCAVKHALDQGRTVLITSHTHVAVDNVLTSLLADDEKYRLNLFQPGRIVRRKPGEEGKLADPIRDHPFLLDDKAAALLTNREEQRAQLDIELKANKDHEDRAHEQELQDRVYSADINDENIRRLDKEKDIYQSWLNLNESLTRIGRTMVLLDQQLRSLEAQAVQYQDIDQETATIAQKLNESETALRSWSTQADMLEAHFRQAETVKNALETKIQSLQQPTILPWVRRSRKRDLAIAVAQRNEIARSAELLQTQAAHVRSTANQWSITNNSLRTAYTNAKTKLSKRDDLRREWERTSQQVGGQSAQKDTILRQQTELSDILGDPEAWKTRYATAEKDGSMALIHEWDVYVARVQKLDNEKKQIKIRLKKLEDEYQQTRRQLLSQGGAPVIAITLDSLICSDELAQRRFDIVIIDEVASAEPVKVLYAAAKADQTCALVGDFLQNAPVTEAEDPTTDEQRITAAWQTRDIFSLAGITDRNSAEQHPHCVALSLQYRFPPLIADVVNAFCYDGLLRSFQSMPAETIVFFHDISGLKNYSFERVDKSLRCKATAELAVTIARGLAKNGEINNIGFVTPYKQQQLLASRYFAEWEKAGGSQVECGTAHAFQGREMDAIIVDLMQDDTPRWVSAADIHGNDRALSAAKLLNVAITRTKKYLHLIGDWEFINATPTPGMKALADLQYQDGFELIRHTS